ncbi:MAG: tyrosinase [Actinomycetota bacterium]
MAWIAEGGAVATTLERRNVYSFEGPWAPELRAYALAIGVMRNLPDSDPRSLGYQASVHGVGSPVDPPPDQFRSQCQHNCWYFLPWHRWYLYYFEQIIRSLLPTIKDVPSDVAANWALPYWNYAKSGQNRLPPEFGERSLWDGRDNPLFDGTRAAGVSERTAALDPRVVAPGPGVLGQAFTSPSDQVATFGGTESQWHHFREPSTQTGGLETTPHNAVHGFVSGDMSDFATAGLDPVFWLHHCNIDRYWEVRGHGSDPDQWTVPFFFRDAAGATRQVVSNECVDTVGQLGYRYDDVAPPLPVTATETTRTARIAMSASTPPPDLPPEVVGSRGSVTLAGERVDAPLQVGPVSNQFRTARAGESEPKRVYLTIEGIRGQTDPGISYGVYLGDVADEHLAGVISFFGIQGTADGGHGLGYSFDVTDIVDALRDDAAWDLNDVHVVFEPVGAIYDDPPPNTPVPSVDIGTVNIVFH